MTGLASERGDWAGGRARRGALAAAVVTIALFAAADGRAEQARGEAAAGAGNAKGEGEGEGRAARDGNADADGPRGIFGPVRLGPVVGLGVVRPFNVGLTAKYHKWLGFGFNYGVFPSMKLPARDAKVDFAAAEGYLDWHPFQDGFFVGAGLGYESVNANLNSVSGTLSTLYATPRIGWFWTSDSGLSIGFDLGVQIPINPSSTMSAPTPAIDASGARPSDEAQVKLERDKDDVQKSMDFVGKIPLPTVSLLRVGWLF